MKHGLPMCLGFFLLFAFTRATGFASPEALSELQETATNLVVTFESLSGGSQTVVSSYSENGVNLSRGVSDPALLGDSTDTALAANGTKNLRFTLYCTDWRIDIGGNMFDAKQVDLAEYSTVFSGSRAPVTFVGYKVDGSTVSTTFTMDGVIDGPGGAADFETFRFPDTFVDLVQIKIPSSCYSIDNLIVSPSANGTVLYHTLTVAGGKGSVFPANGAQRYVSGVAITATAPASVIEGTNLFVCAGATVAGNAYTLADATTATLTLANDATLTWQWQALPLPAAATPNIVVTFDPPSYPHVSRGLDSYDQNGVHFGGKLSGSFTHTDNGFDLFPNDGSAVLSVNRAYAYFDMGGSVFGVKQVDLAEYSTVYASPQKYGFKGYRADGATTVLATFTTDGVMDGSGPQKDFQTFTFPESFTNLTRVDFVCDPATTTGLPTMDNLVLSSGSALTLQTEGSPVRWGAPLPSGYGAQSVASGTRVINSVASPVEYSAAGIRCRCLGWTGTGSVAASGTGTTVVASVTQNSTLKWIWQTQYRLTVPSSRGGVIVGPSGWIDGGSNVVLQAVAADGFRLLWWIGDTNGCLAAGNVITVPMTRARNVSAVFESEGDSAPGTLVFWNRLGSEAEVQNSAVGPGGTRGLGTYAGSPFGKGLRVDTTNGFAATFPVSLLPKNQGCIEFWASVSDERDTLSEWGCLLLGIADAQGNTYSLLGFSGDNGASDGGLVAQRPGLGTAGTGTSGTWTYTAALQGACATNWHHYALAWSVDGVPSRVSPAPRVAVYVDGVLNSSHWGSVTDPADPQVFPENGRLGLLWLRSGHAAIDNVKVWNYPKFDFADRFDENAGNTNIQLTVSNAGCYAVPSNGVYALATGTNLDAFVVSPQPGETEATRYACTGAEVSGCAFLQTSATNVTLAVTNAVYLTWQWKRQHRLEVAVEGQGSVSAYAEWNDEGSAVALSATASAGWYFVGWQGATNGSVIADHATTITVPMTQPRALSAVFAQYGTFAACASLPENAALHYQNTSGSWEYEAELKKLVSLPVAAKGNAGFQVVVTGPGVISFGWEMWGSDGTNVIRFSADNQLRIVKTNATPETASVAVPAGRHWLTWVVFRGAQSPEVVAGIGNIDFAPLEQASAPVPGHGQVVASSALGDFTWRGSAEYYRVYAGLSSSRLSLIGTCDEERLTVSALTGLVSRTSNSTVYWRVDACAKDKLGTEVVNHGRVWSVQVLAPGGSAFSADQYISSELTVGVAHRLGPLTIIPALSNGTLRAQVMSGSLPPGIKLLVSGGGARLEGVPTQSGSYPAVIQFTLVSGKRVDLGPALVLNLLVTELNQAAGTFNGWVASEIYGVGSAALNVTSKGAVSGKLSLCGTSYRWSVSHFDGMTNGWLFVRADASVKNSRPVPILLEVSKEGKVRAALVNDADGEFALFRDNRSAAMETIAQVAGTYAVEWSAGEALQLQRGLLNITSQGQAFFAGPLMDETAVTSSQPVLLSVDESTGNVRMFVVVDASTKNQNGLSHGLFSVKEILIDSLNGERSLADRVELIEW